MAKCVLITGAAKGIGRATAEVFAENGYNVIINYLTSEKEAEELKTRLSVFTRAEIYKADVSVKAEVDKMVAFAIEKFGGVDVLVNNAGVAHYGLVTRISENDYDGVYAVNVKGAHLVTAAVLDGMIDRKQGKIINVSSMWGVSGASCEAVYSASKAALIGYTKALAKEVGLSGINVNCVCPGVILTDMVKNLGSDALNDLKEQTALNRLGTPRDVAELIYFLASDKASFITGQAITVDGGFL